MAATLYPMPKRKPLYAVTRDLVAVAAGRKPADLLIRNGRWVNVHSGEILDETCIAILGSRIAYCGPDRPDLVGPETQVLDAEGNYLVPGLLDAHVHVESSMLVVREFAASALRHGTTGAFIDPHEIANVLGLDGVRLMLDESKHTLMQLFIQIPSCVPAAPGLETTGASIGPSDVAEAIVWDGVIGLGEVMNYPGVAAGDDALHAEIAEALKHRRTVGGHYASPDLGVPFHAYVAGGPSDCHEGTRAEDVIARVRQGMAAILRQGSAEHNVATQVRALLDAGLDTRRVLLCTDDRHPDTLLRKGHIDDVVRLAMAEGIEPLAAIRMATLNVAEHFGVEKDVGSIGPGRFADVLVVSDLNTLSIDHVIAAGETVVELGVSKAERQPFAYPAMARNSVCIPRTLTADEFCIPGPSNHSEARCRVIEIVETQVLTRMTWQTLPVRDGRIERPNDSDINYLAVIERHTGSARMGKGLVRGYGITQPYGLASTVAHDSHNLLVMGTERTSMAEAANRVVRMAGGLCLVSGSGETVEIPLPIAGLMSEASIEDLVVEMDALQTGLRALGCRVDDALMSFLFLALPVIPELRLTDLGLVDVRTFEIVPLLEDDDNPANEER